MLSSSGRVSVTGQAPRRALVVHSGGVHVLAAAQSLHARRSGGRGGLRHGEMAHSRAVQRDFAVPPPERDPDDIEVLLLPARRDEIGCVVPYAAHADVVRAIDKPALVEAAGRVGLAVPHTEIATARHLVARVCAGPDEARQVADQMAAAGGGPLLKEVVDGRLSALSVVVDGRGRAASKG